MLKIMDEKIKQCDGNYRRNFSQDIIKEYYNITIKYVLDLFSNTINVVNEGIIADDNTLPMYSKVGMSTLQSPIIEATEESEMMDLYKELQQQQTQTQQKAANNSEMEKLQELENSLQVSFLQYKKYCEELNIADYYNNYGNEEYKKQVKKDLKEFDNDNTTFLSILTLIKYSDVTLFWQDRKKDFPELAIAAGIVLGKPTHNAFQERVFSKGSYMDTKLKKRTSEDTFEINVLNACNTHVMSSLSSIIASINNKKQQQKGTDDSELEMYQKVKAYETIRLQDLEEINNMTELVGTDTTDATELGDSDFESIAVPDVYDDNFDDDSDSETPLIKYFDTVKLNNAEFNRNITDIQLGKQLYSQDSQQMDSQDSQQTEVVFAKVVQHKQVVEDSDDEDDESTDEGVQFMATIKQEKGTVGKTDKNEEPFM
jgi:hypothetical protein